MIPSEIKKKKLLMASRPNNIPEFLLAVEKKLAKEPHLIDSHG